MARLLCVRSNSKEWKFGRFYPFEATWLSKIFLLDRLHQLQKEEYIAPIPNGYRLTEKGATEHIPFTDYNFSKKNAPDLFDWKKPYAPAAGWQD